MASTAGSPLAAGGSPDASALAKAVPKLRTNTKIIRKAKVFLNMETPPFFIDFIVSYRSYACQMFHENLT